MMPDPMLRPRCTAIPAGVTCALLFAAAAASAAPLPEPVLQFSATLSAPVATNAAERELLRVEYRAVQSAQEEADVVGEIAARIRRVEGMIADIHQLIDNRPSNPAPAAAAAGAPDRSPVSAPSRQQAADGTIVDATPLELFGMIALAAALAFIAWRMKERHAFLKTRQRRAAAQAAGATTPVPQPATSAIAPPASLDLDIAGAAATEADAEQAIELTDIMLSMGLTQGAAQTLSEQVHGHPKQALFHWLKLLDIYRRSNMRGDFEQAARDMHMYFNVQVPGWGAGNSETSIEDYPHIAAKLQVLWPSAETGEFLAQLLKDNRGGKRDGFSQSVAEEILLLQHMLAAKEPALAAAQAHTGLSSST